MLSAEASSVHLATSSEFQDMDAPQGHDKNADQIAYWNGAGGQRWADRQAVQDILLSRSPIF